MQRMLFSGIVNIQIKANIGAYVCNKCHRFFFQTHYREISNFRFHDNCKTCTKIQFPA